MKLLGLGDNVCDLYLHTGMMYPGGQALNVAVNAVKLGARSRFFRRIRYRYACQICPKNSDCGRRRV